MKTTLKLLGAAAIMFGVSGATESFAGLLDKCQVYAQVSAKQEQENQLSCKVKLKGDYWTTDLKKHIQYCQSVAPQKWKADLVTRKEQLAKCK
jgi:hypothetical protein